MLSPRRTWLAAVAAALFLCSGTPGLSDEEEEDYEGLPPGEGRDEVFGLCGACHSMKLVTQQGLTRSTWEEVLVFMVEEQEMAELEPEDENLVLDYLARFYGPDRLAKRMTR